MGNIGIYIFKNTKEKKCYIGQSNRLKERIHEHSLNYKTKSAYQDDFHILLREKPELFISSVLEYCTVEELADKEIYWMNRYESEGWELYNTRKKKQVITHRGHIPWNKGKTGIYSEDTLKIMSNNKKGIQLSDNHKFKISESNKGEKNPMFGKHHSEESRKKISEARKGQTSYWKGKTGFHKGKHWRINPETGKREWYDK